VTQQQKTATVKDVTIFTVRISVNWYKGRRVFPIFKQLKFNPLKEDHFRELFIPAERFSNRSIRQ
jgi:hypothetical protein